MRALVGTSGWQYRDWRGPFYPERLAQKGWLEFYAERFPTVEVNAAFYRLPSREVFEDWARRTPPGFVVTVKASRFLTHIKRLADPEEPVGRLMERAAGLGDRLGPILLQLPPNLRADVDRLARCLACFPPGVRVAVEPRHPSWWTDDVRSLLEAYAAPLVWADRGGQSLSPLWVTGDIGYLRLHHGGDPSRADGWAYDGGTLAGWAHRLAAAGTDRWETAFVYFNNDPGCAAVRDARRFAPLLERMQGQPEVSPR